MLQLVVQLFGVKQRCFPATFQEIGEFPSHSTKGSLIDAFANFAKTSRVYTYRAPLKNQLSFPGHGQ